MGPSSTQSCSADAASALLDADGPLSAALLTHWADLAAYVGRITPPTLRRFVEPDDVLHEVCCVAMLRQAEFTPLDATSARRWLFTVARNHISRQVERRTASRVTEPVAAGDDDDPLGRLLTEVKVYDHTPSQSAIGRETWAAVHRSLARLSPDHASVIQARYFDGLSAAEVAARMGRTLAAVNQLLYRAMAALRADLGRTVVHV